MTMAPSAVAKVRLPDLNGAKSRAETAAARERQRSAAYAEQGAADDCRPKDIVAEEAEVEIGFAARRHGRHRRSTR
jgi:hypothetical protein